MRVLVVEDDPEISRFIVRGLTEERHLVDLVADGLSAIDMVAAEEYDAVVLDLMLPGVDGFEVCRRMRAQGADTPVIIVTARDGLADRVAGLDGGADDYLVKPFAFEELLARLRALGRRGRTRHMTHVLEYGPIAVDPVAHTVSVPRPAHQPHRHRVPAAGVPGPPRRGHRHARPAGAARLGRRLRTAVEQRRCLRRLRPPQAAGGHTRRRSSTRCAAWATC